MKFLIVLKNYRENRGCPLCDKNLHNSWAAQITIPIEILLCTDCFYDRKQFFFGFLRGKLPIVLNDLKPLGIDLSLNKILGYAGES